MARLMLMFATGLVAVLAFGAGEYTWVGDASSCWTNPASYKLGVETPSDPPPAAATVILPANSRASIDDDSIGYVTSLGRLQVASSAQISINLTVSNAVLGCAIAGTSTSAPCGRVVKTGSYKLTLSSVGRVVSSSKHYDYYTAFEVREGEVVFPQGASGLSGKYEYTGLLAVSNNATITLPDNAATYATQIGGAGTIACAAASSRTLRVLGSGTSEFSGNLTGTKLALDAYYGTVLLNGVESDFGGTVALNGPGAVLGAAKLGRTTDAASSIGTAGTIYVKEKGGMIRCLNTAADETDKIFSFYPAEDSSADNTGFDAGAFGGVTFTGDWQLYDNKSYQARMRWLVLTGSNVANACTMAGNLPQNSGNDDGVPYTFTLTKRGTGIWKFAGTKTFAGAVNVDEGTLQFDSLGEKGESSSLGKATMLYEEYSGAKSSERTVDYAIRLGDGGKGSEGTIEYVGTGFAGAKDRPIAMNGDGRLRHSGTNGFIRLYGGVSALTAGAKTLTLDGDAVDGLAADCELANVADAADRPISIVKEGSGVWALTGNQDIRGSIHVKGGTLYLRNPVHYTWFRWTLKEPVTAASGNYRVSEFGLFDANSNRVNTAMTVPNVYASPRGNLQYGEAAFTNSVSTHSSGPLKNIFDSNGTSHWRSSFSGRTFDAADESKWIPIVMHVSAEAPVCYFDFYPYNPSSQPGAVPKIFSLEGSADGVAWYEIASENSVSASASDWYYKRSKGAYRAIDTSVPMAERATAFLPNVESVRVDSGATLKMEGDVTLANLVVDAAGAGTIVGGALASDGSINVLVDPDASRTELPISFNNVDGVENLAGWSLKVNGEENSDYRLAVSSGGTLKLVKKTGLLLIFR